MNKDDEIIWKWVEYLRTKGTAPERFQGTSDEEMYELADSGTRIACPVCRSTFRRFPAPGEIECPFCGIVLVQGSVEAVGHQEGEINPEIKILKPLVDIFGEFFASSYPKGMRYCDFCEEIYPVKFSCCPELLIYGLNIFKKYKKENKEEIVIGFYKKHIGTLKAAIPHIILPKLKKKKIKTLIDIGKRIGINDYIKNSMEEE